MEIEFLIDKYGIEGIKFFDSTFTINKGITVEQVENVIGGANTLKMQTKFHGWFEEIKK